jgi:hypothetical protein
MLGQMPSTAKMMTTREANAARGHRWLSGMLAMEQRWKNKKTRGARAGRKTAAKRMKMTDASVDDCRNNYA